VFVLTDDQRWDSLGYMDTVQRDLVGHGVNFSNAFVVNPMCCPSRASILSGQWSHTTGVFKNSPPDGGFVTFEPHETNTIATTLQAAGYRTGMIGKYLNGYDELEAGHVPPGWDRWFAFTTGSGNGAYQDVDYSDDGKAVATGAGPADYSTTVLADKAVDFIRTTPANQSLFLYLAVKAPHLPATPAPQYAQAFADLPPYRPPSFNEADVSDKPKYIRDLPLLTPTEIADIDATRLNQLRTLLSVDDAVGRLVDTLRAEGRLSSTMLVFMSDNGWLYGEHRRTQKSVPYEESIRVPLVIRYDPMTASARTDAHLALNVDLAPTFAALAGTSQPGAEGSSLLPLLGPGVPRDVAWRTNFLVEHLGAGATYCAVRATSAIYVIYQDGEEELYDLKADPYELQNLAGDPAHADLLESLRARTRKLCQPPVPGVEPK
jgi:arylsulfatase A-like enzyme